MLAQTQAGVTRHPDFSRLDRAMKQFILTHRASQGGVLIASLLGKSRLVEVNLFLGEQVSVRGKFVTGGTNWNIHHTGFSMDVVLWDGRRPKWGRFTHQTFSFGVGMFLLLSIGRSCEIRASRRPGRRTRCRLPAREGSRSIFPRLTFEL